MVKNKFSVGASDRGKTLKAFFAFGTPTTPFQGELGAARATKIPFPRQLSLVAAGATETPYGRTDGRTDGWTDGRTDTYGHVRTHTDTY